MTVVDRLPGPTDTESLPTAPPPIVHDLLARLGEPHGRLLAGPPGTEMLTDHLARLGPLGPLDPDTVVSDALAAGLQGRGGAEFPLSTKLSAARGGRLASLVVANGSEGEPASRKDAALLRYRPHLVLDGLAAAASAVGATDTVVYVHPEEYVVSSLRLALAQRRAEGIGPHPVQLVAAPRRFVAGESSAVVSFLERGEARPRRTGVPVAIRGVHGRPTVVSNVETLAHLGLVVRAGAEWFRRAGSTRSPGSSLLTLAGAVRSSGQVVEALGPMTLGTVLAAAGGIPSPPPAVLIGGYGGSWVSGPAAWDLPIDRWALRQAGFGLGCGLLAPLAPGACGLWLTLDLLTYMAGQSAGQCGACVHGLSSLAGELSVLVQGRGRRADVLRLVDRGFGLRGAGGCAHPDGAVALLESALAVFADDLQRHLKGRVCTPVRSAGWFPLPGRGSDGAPSGG